MGDNTGAAPAAAVSSGAVREPEGVSRGGGGRQRDQGEGEEGWSGVTDAAPVAAPSLNAVRDEQGRWRKLEGGGGKRAGVWRCGEAELKRL